MIYIKKEYRTRSGKEVRIYIADAEANKKVVGGVKLDNMWAHTSWYSNGKYFETDEESSLDLIEVEK